MALITGGASGIGLFVAKHLVGQGWNVMIVDYNEEGGRKAARDLGEDKALFTRADVADYDQQAKAFVATWKQWSRLDFVFANAVSFALLSFSVMIHVVYFHFYFD